MSRMQKHSTDAETRQNDEDKDNKAARDRKGQDGTEKNKTADGGAATSGKGRGTRGQRRSDDQRQRQASESGMCPHLS